MAKFAATGDEISYFVNYYLCLSVQINTIKETYAYAGRSCSFRAVVLALLPDDGL